MEAFVLYNLKVAVCLAVFYLFYKLLLSRETFHRLNRVLLLGAVALSFVLPICVVTIEREVPAAPVAGAQTIHVQRGTGDAEPEVIEAEMPRPAPVAAESVSEPFPWAGVGVGIFVVGVVLSLIGTLISLLGTLRMIRRGRLEILEDGLVLSRHDRAVAPFSWGRWIVISEADYAGSGCEVLAHERAHIRCRHSWDLLLTDLMSCLQWFNPAMWLLRAELRAIHEYEADAAVLASGTDAKHYQLLLIKKAVGGRWYSVANSLNHSNLKNRITMMLRKRSSRWARAKSLVVVPLLCIALGAFARTSYVVAEGEDTENFKQPQGFSGGMTVAHDDDRIRVTLDGTGDAMMGASGLITMALTFQPEADTTQLNEFIRIVLSLSPDSTARTLGIPHALAIVDGVKQTGDVSDASRIASFEILSHSLGAKLYGTQGGNGAVVIVSKRPDEPSAAFAEESVRDDPNRRWFRGEGIYGIPGVQAGFAGSQGGGRVPTQEQADEWREQDDRSLEQIPLERFFVGAVSSRLTAEGAIDFTVYGVGDVMMAAGSMLYNMRESSYKNLEAARALSRLSRSAQDSPGLMADPMPLCLVDGKAVTSYAAVPQADRIATMIVYDVKSGVAKFGSRGANGVVDIVSTTKRSTSLERVKANAGNLAESYGVMSCLPDHPEEGLVLTRGFIAGCGFLAGGVASTDCEEMSAALAVVDGVVVPCERLPLIRPSQMLTVEFVYDPKEIARYTDDPDMYEYMVRITTKHDIEVATAGVKVPTTTQPMKEEKRVTVMSAPAKDVKTITVMSAPGVNGATMALRSAPQTGPTMTMMPAPGVKGPTMTLQPATEVLFEMRDGEVRAEAGDKPRLDPTRMEMVLPDGRTAIVSTLGMRSMIKRAVDMDFSRVPGALYLVEERESTQEEVEKLFADGDRGRIFMTIVEGEQVVELYGPAAEKGVVFVSRDKKKVNRLLLKVKGN